MAPAAFLDTTVLWVGSITPFPRNIIAADTVIIDARATAPFLGACLLIVG